MIRIGFISISCLAPESTNNMQWGYRYQNHQTT